MHLAIYPRRVESFMLRSGTLEVFPFGVRALSMILFHKVSFFCKLKFLQPGNRTPSYVEDNTSNSFFASEHKVGNLDLLKL